MGTFSKALFPAFEISNFPKAVFPELCIRLYMTYTGQPQAWGEQGWPQGEWMSDSMHVRKQVLFQC